MNLPGFFWTHVWRLAIYGQLERPEEADETMTKLLALYPSFAENSRVELEKFNMHPTLAEHVVEGWKKAGLFDEPPPPTRPVIAVLPFDNMSGDPEQDYFADGITEDLTPHPPGYRTVALRGPASDRAQLDLSLQG